MGRKSKANIRKQEILYHFYEVIIEEGFEGASIAKIARKMEVNPSLIIHYFQTKDKMILGLIEYIIETYSSQILPDFSEVNDPTERWEDVVDVLSRIQWDTFIHTTVFYSAYTLGFRNAEIKEKFTELYQSVHEKLLHEILMAKEAGIIDVKHPQQVSKLILSLIEGANFYQHVDDSLLEPVEEEDKTQRNLLLKKTIKQITSSGLF